MSQARTFYNNEFQSWFKSSSATNSSTRLGINVPFSFPKEPTRREKAKAVKESKAISDASASLADKNNEFPDLIDFSDFSEELPKPYPVQELKSENSATDPLPEFEQKKVEIFPKKFTIDDEQ